MAFTFSDLKSEVKRRSTRNQGGSQFDTGIANTINTAMWRIAREARWRNLRRQTTFDTIIAYNTGTGNGVYRTNSKNISCSGATFLTDDVNVGRYAKFSGSSKYFKVVTLANNTSLTVDQFYDGTNTNSGTYSILGQEEYVLPIQVGHSCFLWHRAFGYPFLMGYSPTQEFYRRGVVDTMENVPQVYRMWGVDWTIEQLKSPSTITISSSSSSDTSIAVSIFGIVSGYPDYEIITTNSSDGTTSVSGSKIFSSIERTVSNQTRVGRITITGNSGNATVSVLPVGATTTGALYTKLQIYPLPNKVFPINVLYYKLPYQLVNDGDVPELGEEFSEAIILLATAKMNAEQNKSEDEDFIALYKDEIDSLKKTNVDKIDWLPKLQKPQGNYGDIWTGGLRYAQIGNSGMFGPTVR